MKIRQLMIAMLGVFAMTACTQTDRAQESAESRYQLGTDSNSRKLETM